MDSIETAVRQAFSLGGARVEPARNVIIVGERSIRRERKVMDVLVALAVWAHRIRHYVGAYLAQLGGLDAVVFTAGIGENAPALRARALDGLGHLGLAIDADRNGSPSREARVISPEGAPVAVLVVPTNEELAIAQAAAALVA